MERKQPGSNAEVELLFSDVSCFQYNASPDPNIRPFAVRMNEKCISGTCSFEKINRCLKDATMSCLPKVFYGILHLSAVGKVWYRFFALSRLSVINRKC